MESHESKHNLFPSSFPLHLNFHLIHLAYFLTMSSHSTVHAKLLLVGLQLLLFSFVFSFFLLLLWLFFLKLNVLLSLPCYWTLCLNIPRRMRKREITENYLKNSFNPPDDVLCAILTLTGLYYAFIIIFAIRY
jgi:hypothetical protein